MFATDFNPSLRIEYPCPTGRTLGSLSRVLVYNRNDKCSNWIMRFIMDFQRDNATAFETDPDVQPYRFQDANGVPIPLYDINITKATPCSGANGVRVGVQVRPRAGRGIC